MVIPTNMRTIVMRLEDTFPPPEPVIIPAAQAIPEPLEPLVLPPAQRDVPSPPLTEHFSVSDGEGPDMVRQNAMFFEEVGRPNGAAYVHIMEHHLQGIQPRGRVAPAHMDALQQLMVAHDPLDRMVMHIEMSIAQIDLEDIMQLLHRAGLTRVIAERVARKARDIWVASLPRHFRQTEDQAVRRHARERERQRNLAERLGGSARRRRGTG